MSFKRGILNKRAERRKMRGYVSRLQSYTVYCLEMSLFVLSHKQFSLM